MSEMNIDLVKFAAIVYGDGYLAKGGRLYFNHSILQQAYAEHKADFCNRTFGLKPVFRIIKLREGSFSTNDGFEVSFHAQNWVKVLRDNWYNGSTKLVPPELLSQFGWDEWSFLFQDDGRQNKISHFNTVVDSVRIRTQREPVVNRYEICLGYCTDVELSALIYSLSNLGVYGSILNRNDGQRNISISRADAKIKFYENMLPRMHPNMLYKLNLPPTFTYTS
jgi:hypothetical protein